MNKIVLSFILPLALSGLCSAQTQPKTSAITELNGAGSGAAAVPPASAPEHVKPQPQHVPGYGQPGAAITEFQSGEFDSYSEARKSLQKALAGLKAKGVAVLETHEDNGGYTITFVAPRAGRVAFFESREYESRSGAEKVMNKLAGILEAGGAAVLEQNLGANSFRLQYADVSGYEGGEGRQRVMEFQSSEFDSSFTMGEIRQSMEKAVRSLTAAGHKVASAETVYYNRYSIIFVVTRPLAVQTYESREFTFTDDLKKAMGNAVKTLESSGYAVLEQNRNSYSTFRLQFLAPAGHGGFGSHQRLVEFKSSDFTFADDRKEAMDKAVRSLTAAGHVVVSAEPQEDHYNLSFMASRPVVLREMVSREYTFSDDRKEAMRRAVQGLENYGAAVAEQSYRGDRFVIRYFEPRDSQLFQSH